MLTFSLLGELVSNDLEVSVEPIVGDVGLYVIQNYPQYNNSMNTKENMKTY
jgi:hypothetical protein